MGLAAQSVFRGTDTEVYMEGKWLTNATSVDATTATESKDLNLLGHYWTQYRNVGLKGSGNIKGVFVNTELLEKLSSIQKGIEYRTELVIKNYNPDVDKTYRVRLMNVVFTNIPLANFTAGDISAQDFSFNFSGYEILDKV